jgi:hypothetical protein
MRLIPKTLPIVAATPDLRGRVTRALAGDSMLAPVVAGMQDRAAVFMRVRVVAFTPDRAEECMRALAGVCIWGQEVACMRVLVGEFMVDYQSLMATKAHGVRASLACLAELG